MGLASMQKPEEFKKLDDEDLKLLDNLESVKEKILTMSCLLELTRDDLDERTYIHQNIYKLLKPFYPECSVLVFGSSVNGFGFKGCDLDLLFVPFPNYCNLDFNDRENSFIPSPYSIRTGRYPKEKLLEMNEHSHLKFVQRVLFTMRNVFSKVIFIPAKCPILKIEFYEFSLPCDLSCSNRLVTYNSELLRFYATLDPRIRPLIMVLRYWAKSLGFIKKSLLSSYAFSLLVIFSLQNAEPPVIPSVESLNELAGFSRKIDGWETAFTVNVQSVPKSENSASVEQLMIHFFDFYWNFNYNENVVSPYHGKPLPVIVLKNSNDERIQSFPVTSFSIQDLFLLSRNISRNSSMKTSFQLALLIAKEFLLKETFSFHEFFDIDFYQKRMNLIYEPTLQYFSEQCLTFPMCLDFEIISKLGITSEFSPWYDMASQTVLDVLQYGLLMECEVIDKIICFEEIFNLPNRKKIKISNDPILKSIGDLKLLISIQCAVRFNSWSYRKKVTEVELDDELDLPEILKREYAISKRLSFDPHEHTKAPFIWFTCNCYKYSAVQLPDIVFIISPITNVKGFLALATFLKSFLPKTVLKLLKE